MLNGRQQSAAGLTNSNQHHQVNGGIVQPTAPGGPPQSQMGYPGGYMPQGMQPGVITRLVPGPGGMPGPPGAQTMYYTTGPGGPRPMVGGPGQLQHMQGGPPPMNAGSQPPPGVSVRYAPHPHPQAMGRGMPVSMAGMQRPPQHQSYLPMQSMQPGMRVMRGQPGMQPGPAGMAIGGPSSLPPGSHPMSGQPGMYPPVYGPPAGTQVGVNQQGQPVMMMQQSPRKQPGKRSSHPVLYSY